MMSQLRWALLIVGVVFIVLLAWWERRRPRQASGALERASPRESTAELPPRLVREPPLTLPEMRVREPLATRELPVVAATRVEVSLPVLEPAARGTSGGLAAADELSTTAELRALDELDGAALHGLAGQIVDEAADEPAAMPPTLAEAPDPALEAAVATDEPAQPPREGLPELIADTALVVDWPPEHERRILALRLVARQRERFAGRSLRQALAAEGFLLGQFAIFHKPDDERRAVLSAASLTRPGTFDMETMDSQHYGGLSLFAVLPGPKSPPQAFDELVFAARNLNERLDGVLQDEQGTPLTPARIAQLREQLRAGARS